MAISFPTSLDSFTTKTDSVDYPQAIDINDVQDAIEALEAKVGVDNSVVTTSHDYRLSHIIQDYITRGYFERPLFTYNGGSTAYTFLIDAGAYVVKDKFAYWDSQLITNTPGSPTADTWYYLYLDYSAITNGTKITANELVWSTTAPTWNNTYRQWMNGNDRCIFAALTDGTPNNFLETFHDGSLNIYANYIEDVSGVNVSTSWSSTIGTLTLPAFCNKACVTFAWQYGNGTSSLFWRVYGQTGTTGHFILRTNSSVTIAQMTQATVITDNSQRIELKESSATTNTCTIRTNGWYFPGGM